MNDRQLYDFLSRQKNPDISRRYFLKWLTRSGVGGAAAVSLATWAFPSCAPPGLSEECKSPVGCQSGGQDQLLVGVIGTFSGLGEFIGRIVNRSLDATVTELNKRGRVLGKTVNWLKGDSGQDTSAAVQKFTEFSNDPRVIGIMFVGPLGINETRRDMKRLNIPTILSYSDAYSDNKLYPGDPEGPRSMFQFFPPGIWIMEALAKYAKEDRGYSTVGLMYLNLLGTAFERQSAQACEKYGLRITTREQYGLNATDLGPQLQRLRDSKCHTLWVFGLPSDTANVVKGLAQIDAGYVDTPTAKDGSGWHPQLMGDPAGMGERQWAVLAGDAAKVGSVTAYHVGGLIYLPQFAIARWIIDYLGTTPSGGEEIPADSFYTLIKAAEEAGSTDREKMVAAIENGTERQFASVGFSFSKTDHLARKPDDIMIVTLEKGRGPEPTDPPYQLGREWSEGLSDSPFNPTQLVRPTLAANRRRYPEVMDTVMQLGYGTQCTREPDGTLSPRCKVH